MAVQVTELEDVLRTLERLDNAHIRFLTIPQWSAVGRIDEVIQIREPWDPVFPARDVFGGRLLTFGWSKDDVHAPARLDLRFQLQGVHEWPICPIAGVWKSEATQRIGGLLLVHSGVLEYHSYGARYDNACTTVRVASSTARLLQGAP